MPASSVRLHVVRVVAALFVLSLALRRFMQELPKGADPHNFNAFGKFGPRR